MPRPHPVNQSAVGNIGLHPKSKPGKHLSLMCDPHRVSGLRGFDAGCGAAVGVTPILQTARSRRLHNSSQQAAVLLCSEGRACTLAERYQETRHCAVFVCSLAA